MALWTYWIKNYCQAAADGKTEIQSDCLRAIASFVRQSAKNPSVSEALFAEPGDYQILPERQFRSRLCRGNRQLADSDQEQLCLEAAICSAYSFWQTKGRALSAEELYGNNLVGAALLMQSKLLTMHDVLARSLAQNLEDSLTMFLDTLVVEDAESQGQLVSEDEESDLQFLSSGKSTKK